MYITENEYQLENILKYDMNIIDKNELYNLKDDPQERIDVYDKFPKIAEKMEELAANARIE